MDINDLRVAVTVASFLAFLGIVWWAYGARRKQRFEEAARSVLREDDGGGEAPGGAK